MRKLLLIGVLFLFSTAFSRGPDLLTFGGGTFGQSHPRLLYLLEYKSTFLNTIIRPQVGVLSAEFNCCHVYGGIGFEFLLKNCLAVTPSFSPGLYFRNTQARNLGFPIEFRSAISFAYVFSNKGRFGIEFFHLSNAHLANKNPGVNCALLFLSLPLFNQ